MIRFLLAGAIALAPVPAFAQSGAKDEVIDITQPDVVAKAMQRAGYKAEMKTGKDGDPYISSAANGSAFTVQFYGCEKGKGCSSLQFYAWYKREPYYSAAMTNKWNSSKRFLKAAIDSDGDLATYYDVTSLGKTTYANFADAIDWWQSMSSEMFDFLDAEQAAAKAPAAKK